VVRGEGELWRWRLPHQRPGQAGLPAALQLRHRVVDVICGDTGHTVEAVGSNGAVLLDPVIVDPKAGFLQGGVLESEQVHGEARVEHLAAHPVHCHLLHPLVGVPPTRMGLEEPAHLPLGKHRRPIFQGCWQPVLPEVRILDDVRVC
jgi:hypothetical protein